MEMELYFGVLCASQFVISPLSSGVTYLDCVLSSPESQPLLLEESQRRKVNGKDIAIINLF